MSIYANYNKRDAINRIMGVEGGDTYTDRKADRGGKTRYGITERTANDYKSVWTRFNFNGDMSTLPEALAFYIFEQGFWNKLKCDELLKYSPELADTILDIGINKGPWYAGTYLQRLLNGLNYNGAHYNDIKVDGDIGPKTLEALKLFHARRGNEGVKRIVMGIKALQFTSYLIQVESSPIEEENTYGWFNRVFHDLSSIFKHWG